MGMFDRVWIHCPHCGERIEEQSKAGDCGLRDLEVPGMTQDKEDAQAIASVAGRYVCQWCFKDLEVIVSTTAMVLPR